MSDEQENEQDARRLKDALKLLVEHFDAVTILACKHRPANDETMTHQEGFGNIHARAGRVREWLVKHEERAKMMERQADEEEEE